MDRIGKAFFILRSEGFAALVSKVRARLLEYLGRRRLYLPVSLSDVEEADWVEPGQITARRPFHPGPQVIGWVVPPVGPGSGGHLNIFRFVRYLEGRGHTCRVYIYDPHKTQPPDKTAQVLRDHYAPMRAQVQQDFATLADCDAILATSWETAYPVRNARVDAWKFYFVQDFGPDRLLHNRSHPGKLAFARLHGERTLTTPRSSARWQGG